MNCCGRIMKGLARYLYVCLFFHSIGTLGRISAPSFTNELRFRDLSRDIVVIRPW